MSGYIRLCQMITLRPHQEELITRVRQEFFNGKRSVLMVSFVGSGKTVMFSYMTENAVKKGNNVLVLAHREELLDQISETLNMFNVDHGFIAADRPFYPGKKVQVGSVFTVANRMGAFKRPDFIIIDESHHYSKGNTWSKIIDSYPDAKIIGVTATPCRLDGAPLGDHFQSMVEGLTPAELIQKGFLCDYVAYTPSLITTKGLKKSMGDYVKKDVEELMNKKSITGDAVDHWEKFAKGKKTVIFCSSVDHAKAVSEEYNSRGVPAASIDGKLDKDVRRNIINKFRSGEILVLTNYSIVSEGFNLPDIECVQLLRPTASLSLYIQMIGRGLRTSEGKNKLIILDHVQMLNEFGLPDEKREWSLSAKIKKKKLGKNECPIKTCDNCFASNAINASMCNNCGNEFEVKSRNGIEIVSGELTAIDKEKFRKEREMQRKKANSLEDLIALGKARGYKNPTWWAKMVMKARGK